MVQAVGGGGPAAIPVLYFPEVQAETLTDQPGGDIIFVGQGMQGAARVVGDSHALSLLLVDSLGENGLNLLHIFDLG